jgi:hypothetical protein
MFFPPRRAGCYSRALQWAGARSRQVIGSSDSPRRHPTAATASREAPHQCSRFGFPRSAAVLTALLTVAATLHSDLARAQGLPSFDENVQSGWRLSTGVSQEWESNVRFASTAQSDATTRGRVVGARLWRTRRDRVELAASGSLVRFQESSDLNRHAYEASLQASRAISRRMSGSTRLVATSDFTNRTITPQGGEGSLLRGLVAARTYAADGALAYRATRLTTTNIGARYQNVSFDVPTLASGWIAATTAQASRLVSPATTLSLNYEYRRSTAGPRLPDAQRTVNAHELTGGWLHVVNPHVSATLRAGASAQEAAGAEPAFVGGGGLHYQGDQDGFDAQYQRSAGQEFGRETAREIVTDLVGVQYQRSLSSRLRFDANARHSWSDPSRDGAPRARGADGSATIRYELPTGIGIGLGWFVRRRDDTTVAMNQGVLLGLAYGWSQVRNIPVSAEPSVR